MLIILFSLTIILTLGYVFLIFLLYQGLFFLKPGKNRYQYQVSVVVAARNEEENIDNCLQALLNQSYLSDRYEIIIVDDRSDDKTAMIIKNYMKCTSRVRLIQVSELAPGIAPKKQALEMGIHAANGEIILTTDADCIPGPEWIQGMVYYFEPQVGLVAGFSPLEKKGRDSIFTRLLTLDSLSLAAVAAGSFGLGKPLTCNGRNLAYRKVTFSDVDGFKEIQNLISGDDDLFLHLVRQRTNWKLRYATDQQSIVRSIIAINFKQFANQRVRHASKGRYYSNWLKFFLVGVYFLNLILLVLLLISFFISKIFLLWFICYMTKGLSEFFLLYRMAKIFHYKKVLFVFPLAMLLHLPYVVVFGLWGQLGKFQWKKETFRAKTS